MRKFIVPVFSICLLAVGCTSPTQRVADSALQRGLNQDETVIKDLATFAKQKIVDGGAAEARAAAAAGNQEAAQKVVEKVATEFEKVSWLQIQHERARALSRFGQVFIWSQEGILDIIVREFGEAKGRADAKKDAKKDTSDS